MYKGAAQSELDLQLFRVLLKSGKTIVDYARKDVLDRGISFENFIILELLYSRGPQPVQKISERLEIASGSITYVVNKLEKEGLTERKQCGKDARKFYVALTEKGTALFDEMFPKHVAAISKSLSFVTNEEKEQLIHLLKKMALGAKSLDD